MEFIIAWILIAPLALCFQGFLFWTARTFIRRRLPRLSADGLLWAGILSSNGVSLLFTHYRPESASISVGIGASAALHRGWPLPWVGLSGLDIVVLPFFFSASTIFWTFLTCALLYLSVQIAVMASHSLLQRLFPVLAVILLILLAYFVPHIVGSISPV